MSDQYLGEIRLMAYGFIPKGWAPCNGQLLPIGPNQALFALLGTTFGGDGRTTFALPDLRGRVPVGLAGNYPLGAKGGAETVALGVTQMPPHVHGLTGATDGANAGQDPTNAYPAPVNGGYGPLNPIVPLSAESVAPAGAGAAHLNMMPYLTLNFAIALQGIFPSPD